MITIFGYELVRVGNRIHLLHGQSTPGFNKSVPVADLAEAWGIAWYWRRDGVRLPWPAK